MPLPPSASPSPPVYVRLSNVLAMGPHPSGEGRGTCGPIAVVWNEIGRRGQRRVVVGEGDESQHQPLITVDVGFKLRSHAQ